MINPTLIADEIVKILKGANYHLEMFSEEGESVLDARQARWFYSRNGDVGVRYNEKEPSVTFTKNVAVPREEVDELHQLLRKMAKRFDLRWHSDQFTRKIEPRYDREEVVRNWNDNVKETAMAGKDRLTEGEMSLYSNQDMIYASRDSKPKPGFERISLTDARDYFGNATVIKAKNNLDRLFQPSLNDGQTNVSIDKMVKQIETLHFLEKDSQGLNPTFTSKRTQQLWILENLKERVPPNLAAVQTMMNEIIGELQIGKAVNKLSADQQRILKAFVDRADHLGHWSNPDSTYVNRMRKVFKDTEFTDRIAELKFPLELNKEDQDASDMARVAEVIGNSNARYGDEALSNYIANVIVDKARKRSEWSDSEQEFADELLELINKHSG